ncbi:MAG TPA: aminomethyl-transferring glycine dehydrogenase subunit GcvPB, partial [Skermanella sp.]|nr:aminomethyl-transferring glycine dehydrogenase subunit GcvPB [Skermanella sp.]
MLEEPLIFEQDSPGTTGVDLPEPPPVKSRLGKVRERGTIGLPGLSEPEVIRHYTRLSQKNFAIDSGLYPLGSCTMKHNPRLNEKLARLPGLSDIHPMQPERTVQGALELIDTLAHWLKTLTGMPAVAMSPAAGAHGELCGMAAIRAAIEDRDGSTSHRRRVLVPESAHGTNPATAAACGFTVDAIPADATGRVDLEALKAKLGDDVAAIMLTNPNTCGLFERDIIEIAEAVHKAGAFFYCDGANFNAIVGRVRPADLGIDAMHINLHKTFSTPHGGGGPGSGPVVLSEALAKFVPLPYVVHGEDGFSLVESGEDSQANGKEFGRLKGFHGQMGMFVRALAYILSHGADGLRQVASDAVLNANYVMASLKDVMTASFEGPCMHEALFDDRFLKGTGVTTLDFAKAMIDEGYHPMTMYFPLVVHGAFLIEPTETESKQSLDAFIR